jgi:prepilin-type N-terminal cleavage/methylation domain-containing protein
MSDQKFCTGGFTLVEMAIVLAIVALLLGGLLPVISSQIELQRRNDTRKYLEVVRDALVGYAVINGRLPCPDSNDDGTAEATCTTIAQQVGTLPYTDLGVVGTDAYDNVLIYAVTKEFASATPFTLITTGNLKVCDAACASNLTTSSPAVLVSRGANAATAASADEAENTDGDTTFISRDFAQDGYDDLIVWLSLNTLVNRMVAAGKLP